MNAIHADNDSAWCSSAAWTWHALRPSPNVTATEGLLEMYARARVGPRHRPNSPGVKGPTLGDAARALSRRRATMGPSRGREPRAGQRCTCMYTMRTSVTRPGQVCELHACASTDLQVHTPTVVLLFPGPLAGPGGHRDTRAGARVDALAPRDPRSSELSTVEHRTGVR